MHLSSSMPFFSHVIQHSLEKGKKGTCMAMNIAVNRNNNLIKMATHNFNKIACVTYT